MTIVDLTNIKLIETNLTDVFTEMITTNDNIMTSYKTLFINNSLTILRLFDLFKGIEFIGEYPNEITLSILQDSFDIKLTNNKFMFPNNTFISLISIPYVDIKISVKQDKNYNCKIYGIHLLEDYRYQLIHKTVECIFTEMLINNKILKLNYLNGMMCIYSIKNNYDIPKVLLMMYADQIYDPYFDINLMKIIMEYGITPELIDDMQLEKIE